MGTQESGIVGTFVGNYIRRAVRKAFRRLYWIPPTDLPEGPIIYATNHHGWHDGYVMFHVVSALQRPALDWIAEFEAFPLFRTVGGMPFPPNDPQARAITIRKTIRRMRDEKKDLILFAEGILHHGPDLLPFGEALELVAKKVPGVKVVPTAIRYEMNMHERPEAYVLFGAPLDPETKNLRVATRDEVKRLLAEASFRVRKEPDTFKVLAQGTLDVNERWDVRKFKK
ncbi:MAG: 1-acyl-sn-glycerol-3-phosphate acyltransferase [Armatimonadetes bacterium]|nr:1-acyl-sn-glycerol-3-phosphate acyltransferase [Armatimonadota bacterium]